MGAYLVRRGSFMTMKAETGILNNIANQNEEPETSSITMEAIPDLLSV